MHIIDTALIAFCHSVGPMHKRRKGETEVGRAVKRVKGSLTSKEKVVKDLSDRSDSDEDATKDEGAGTSEEVEEGDSEVEDEVGTADEVDEGGGGGGGGGE
eukprot:1135205-Prorocentrum_minimum.AAC.1